MAVEKFLKNNPPRIYVVELTDGISRWFYIFPAKVKFEKKGFYRVFVVKEKEAIEEILKRIASGEFSKKFRLSFLTVLQILIGFAPFVITYIAGNTKSLKDLFNYLIWAGALISAIQGIKRGYKEPGRVVSASAPHHSSE